MQLFPGDQLLLCSDGLSDLVKEDEILAAFEDRKIPDALSAMVDLANERGGHDNITILVLKMPTPHESPTIIIKPTSSSYPTTLPWLTCAIMGIMAILILALIATGVWFVNRPQSTPTPTSTLLPDTPIPATLTLTPEDLTPTETPLPSETPIQPTLTPWPTNSP
jgi:protein phosphatase